MINKKITLGLLTGISFFSLAIAVTPISRVEAQTTSGASNFSMIIDLNRAKNLARMAAERENGGLGFYRAESKMHGLPVNTDHVDNGDSWTFTFLGYQVINGMLMSEPTIQSVVTVSKDGQSITIDYNGAIR
jgi:hypothetical protein